MLLWATTSHCTWGKAKVQSIGTDKGKEQVSSAENGAYTVWKHDTQSCKCGVGLWATAKPEWTAQGKGNFQGVP